jgi:hypothetical protein
MGWQSIIDLTAKTPKMKKYSLNIKLLFADLLEKGTFCSEIKIAEASKFKLSLA